MKNYLSFRPENLRYTPENRTFVAKRVEIMLKKGICGVLAALVAAAFWSCGRRPAYVSVDGVMLGTTLHVAADVRGVSPQELYAAVITEADILASKIISPASRLGILVNKATGVKENF